MGGFGPLGQWIFCMPTIHVTYGMLPLPRALFRQMSVGFAE